MAENLSYINVSNFSGGLNTYAEDSQRQPNEAREVTNFQFSLNGSLTKRSGSSKYNSSAIDAYKVSSIYRYYKSASSYKKLLAVVNGELYEGTDGTFGSSRGSLTVTTPCSFETWKDVCYIANGTVFKTYDGTTLANVGGSPPIGKYVIFHKNRLFIAGVASNPNIVYFCDADTPTTWSTSTNIINVRLNDGDKITGLAVLGNDLIIYKNNSIWLLYGTSLDNFGLMQVSNSIGCSVDRTLVAYETLHYFLSKEGVFSFNGTSLQNLSTKVQPELDAISSTYFSNCVATIYKRQYYLSYTASGTTNNKILVYNLRVGAWSTFEGINAECFSIWNNRDDTGQIYSGDSTGGYVWMLDTGNVDGTTNITVRFSSKYFDLSENLFQYGELKFATLIPSESMAIITMLISMDWQSTGIKSIIFPPSTNISTWDTATWDNDFWATGLQKKFIKAIPFDGNNFCTNVSITIQETSNINWKLLGFGVVYDLKKPEYRILS